METSDSSYAPNLDQVPELRIVLLGATGAGKSATGNTLLGDRPFKSSASRQSCTIECSVEEVERFGSKLVVVDTPGTLDTSMSEAEIEGLLTECTHFACPGVHAFLFLMKIGERNIAYKDQRTYRLLTEKLGKEFQDHTVVVFTAKECLENQPFDQFISGLPDTCKDILKSCKGGYLAISNFGREEKEEAAKQIVNKVKELVQKNGNKCYKNLLFDKENEEIRERMEEYLNKNMDRKKARISAYADVQSNKTVKTFITRVALAGGAVAAVATGGIAGVAFAGFISISGAMATAAGVAAGTTVGGAAGVTTGLTVRKFSSTIFSKVKGIRIRW